MSVRVTFIGTKGGPAYRAANSPNSTSTMISVGDNHYVVDCGLGSTKGILDGGVQLNNINAVVITHHHSDHNIEFGTLIHSAWVSGLNSTIQGYGPPGMHNLWRGTLISQTYDIETRIGDEGRPDLKKLVDIVEYGPGLLFDDGTVKVTAFRNVHPPVTDSFAIKFETKCGKVIVVSGDTAFMPELAEFSKGADLLVHEAMLLQGAKNLAANANKRGGNASRLLDHLLASHSTPEEAGEIATLAEVKHLALNHLIPIESIFGFVRDDFRKAAETTWEGTLSVPNDGDVIEL